MRRTHDDEAVYDVGVPDGHGPRDETAPTMTDDDGVALTEGAHQSGCVRGQGRQVVPTWRLVAGAVTAKVGCCRTQPRFGETDELVPPVPPELREAVQQQDEPTAAELGDVEAV